MNKAVLRVVFNRADSVAVQLLISTPSLASDGVQFRIENAGHFLVDEIVFVSAISELKCFCLSVPILKIFSPITSFLKFSKEVFLNIFFQSV